MRPPPARLRWKPGLLAAPGGMLPSLGGGHRGEGRWRLVTGVCVFRAASPGRGRKLPSQLQLLSEQSNSATLRAPRPSPARPAGTGAALRLGARRRARRGTDLGAGEWEGAWLEMQEWHRYRGVGLGVRLPAIQSWKRPVVPAPRTPPAAPTARLGARPGAEDGGGALETVPRG